MIGEVLLFSLEKRLGKLVYALKPSASENSFAQHIELCQKLRMLFTQKPDSSPINAQSVWREKLKQVSVLLGLTPRHLRFSNGMPRFGCFHAPE